MTLITLLEGTDMTQIVTIDVQRLQPHQQRVVAEKDELLERLMRLRAFIDGPVYATIDKEEQRRLVRQAVLMGRLADVLLERITAFVE